MAVYRTAAVGQLYRLDIGSLLIAWTDLPDDLRSPMSCVGIDSTSRPSREHFCPPEKAAGVARHLLERLAPEEPTRAGRDAHLSRIAGLDAEPDAGRRARLAIAALAARVAELGWLVPFHGIARQERLSLTQNMGRGPIALQNEWPWLPAGEEHRVLRHAWCVCAVSYLSPPLILWSREPSLAWWRGDYVISLRWLGIDTGGGAR